MRSQLGVDRPDLGQRVPHPGADGLPGPLGLIATRLPDEEVVFREMNRLAWSIIEEAFSSRVITPGVTRTEDVVWWMRQRVNDLGLGTWFQPSVSVQRKGMKSDQLGADPVIQPGDVLHCDVGITVARLNTDTQHNAYVLRPGETDAPAGLKQALANANAMQDFAMEETRPGRSGNEILGAVLTRMKGKGITGTMYSHPIGMHGHGARPHLCHFQDCERAVPGHGFPRRYNLFDHMKRVHQFEGPTTEASPIMQGQAQRKPVSRKRKASAEDITEKRPKVVKLTAEQQLQQRREQLATDFASKKQHIIDFLSNLTGPNELSDDLKLSQDVMALHDISTKFRSSYGG